MLTLEEMIKLTIEFYNSLGIKISKEDEMMAVQSLTMPDYAKEYNDKNNEKIKNHRALSTVGDAVCGEYIMLKEYDMDITSKELTDKKKIVTNDHLNIIGKNLLSNKLFAMNNDLKESNKKSYATAFEAVIGFISIINKNKVDEILNKYLMLNV